MGPSPEKGNDHLKMLWLERPPPTPAALVEAGPCDPLGRLIYETGKPDIVKNPYKLLPSDAHTQLQPGVCFPIFSRCH